MLVNKKNVFLKYLGETQNITSLLGYSNIKVIYRLNSGNWENWRYDFGLNALTKLTKYESYLIISKDENPNYTLYENPDVAPTEIVSANSQIVLAQCNVNIADYQNNIYQVYGVDDTGTSWKSWRRGFGLNSLNSLIDGQSYLIYSDNGLPYNLCPEPTSTPPASTPNPTATPAPTQNPTATPAPTQNPTATPNATALPTPSATSTPVATSTPIPTGTSTPLPTITNTPVSLENKKLFSWGSNNFGQLGSGDTVQYSAPKILESLNLDFSQISGSLRSTYAIRYDGKLFGCGHNYYGQLGIGNTSNSLNLIQVGQDSWNKVSGNLHVLGINSLGKLYYWGHGDSRAGLGTNDMGIYRSPTLHPLLSDQSWIDVSAGYYHSLAIRSDGKLFAWGHNDKGQIGDGSLEERNTPTQIGNEEWVKVSAGFKHSMAIRSDGKLFAWGQNDNRVLGDGTTINRNVPTQIGNDNWLDVSTSRYHTNAIREDGKLFQWSSLESLYYFKSATHVPEQIGNYNWIKVSAGGFHTLALRSDKSLYAWGINSNSQLGIGSNYLENQPVFISNNIKEIHAGYESSFLIADQAESSSMPLEPTPFPTLTPTISTLQTTPKPTPTYPPPTSTAPVGTGNTSGTYNLSLEDIYNPDAIIPLDVTNYHDYGVVLQAPEGYENYTWKQRSKTTFGWTTCVGDPNSRIYNLKENNKVGPYWHFYQYRCEMMKNGFKYHTDIANVRSFSAQVSEKDYLADNVEEKIQTTIGSNNVQYDLTNLLKWHTRIWGTSLYLQKLENDGTWSSVGIGNHISPIISKGTFYLSDLSRIFNINYSGETLRFKVLVTLAYAPDFDQEKMIAYSNLDTTPYEIYSDYFSFNLPTPTPIPNDVFMSELSDMSISIKADPLGTITSRGYISPFNKKRIKKLAQWSDNADFEGDEENEDFFFAQIKTNINDFSIFYKRKKTHYRGTTKIHVGSFTVVYNGITYGPFVPSSKRSEKIKLGSITVSALRRGSTSRGGYYWDLSLSFPKIINLVSVGGLFSLILKQSAKGPDSTKTVFKGKTGRGMDGVSELANRFNLNRKFFVKRNANAFSNLNEDINYENSNINYFLNGWEAQQIETQISRVEESDFFEDVVDPEWGEISDWPESNEDFVELENEIVEYGGIEEVVEELENSSGDGSGSSSSSSSSSSDCDQDCFPDSFDKYPQYCLEKHSIKMNDKNGNRIKVCDDEGFAGPCPFECRDASGEDCDCTSSSSSSSSSSVRYLCVAGPPEFRPSTIPGGCNPTDDPFGYETLEQCEENCCQKTNGDYQNGRGHGCDPNCNDPTAICNDPSCDGSDYYCDNCPNASPCLCNPALIGSCECYQLGFGQGENCYGAWCTGCVCNEGSLRQAILQNASGFYADQSCFQEVAFMAQSGVNCKFVNPCPECEKCTGIFGANQTVSGCEVDCDECPDDPRCGSGSGDGFEWGDTPTLVEQQVRSKTKVIFSEDPEIITKLKQKGF